MAAPSQHMLSLLPGGGGCSVSYPRPGSPLPGHRGTSGTLCGEDRASTTWDAAPKSSLCRVPGSQAWAAGGDPGQPTGEARWGP